MKNLSSVKDLKHLKYLDALRGIAVVGVILVHCTVATLPWRGGRLFEIGFTGQRGVQLFYVISAFTLFYSLLNRKKDEKNPLFNFYIRRFFRIAPLYYVAIILNLCYQGLSPRDIAPNGLHIYEVISGFLFLNGLIPNAINSVAIGGWSIAVETSFYLIAPFLFKYIASIRKALIITVLSIVFFIILSTLLIRVMGEEYREYFSFLYFPIQFPIFCIGILTFHMWLQSNKVLNDTVSISKKQVSSIYMLLSIVILILGLPFNNGNMHLTSFSFLLIILSLSLYEWKLLVNKITLYLGKISYSIYLMHFFILIAFDKFFKSVALDYFSTHYGSPTLLVIYLLPVLLASVAVCSLTYEFIEKPGIAAGKKIISKFESKGNYG